MKRETLKIAARTIADDLRLAGVAEMFHEIISRTRPNSKEEKPAEGVSFSVFQDLSLRSQKYGPAERQILEIMDLSILLEARFWQSLLSDPGRGHVFSISSSVRFATNFLPKLASLLDRDYPESGQFDSADVSINYKDKSLLKLILGEEGSQFSSTERLILALSSLQGLYDVINEVNGLKEEKLLVLGIDSGSDKQFDILGIAAAIADTKELILALYDRMVFKRHSQSSKTIEVIAQSLPVFEKIGELEANKHFGPEQAELLKRKLFASLQGFVDSGAIIPEMEHALVVEPRIVMQPQPKLLMAPQGVGHGAEQDHTDETKGGSSREEQSEKSLSPEEVENLENLLRRAGYVSKPAGALKSKPARPRGRPRAKRTTVEEKS